VVRALHTIGDSGESLATMFDEFLFEIWSHAVAYAGRHTWQHVHNLHARPTTRCKSDGLLERRVVGGNGIDSDEMLVRVIIVKGRGLDQTLAGILSCASVLW
jgi:hypothetical protein